MIISDELYGEYKIERVLEELVNSKPVKRLQGIHQSGASYLVNEKWNVSRYEHSIGVMLLIRKLGGSIEEQIAGLLHDVSHTTFSHVIDFVLNNQDEDYHDRIVEDVITTSEIPTILNRYGYSYKDILINDSKWTILEQPAPELCADRVDYTLRDMLSYGKISFSEVQEFLGKIIIVEGKMYVKDIIAAEWFVETYYKEVIDFFMNPLNIYGYDRLAKTIKLALDKNLLVLDDMLKEDEEVMSILRSSKEVDVQHLLEQIHQHVKVEINKTNYDIHRKNKIRLINPSVLYQEEPVPASKLSKRVKEMNENAYLKASEGVYVKVVSS